MDITWIPDTLEVLARLDQETDPESYVNLQATGQLLLNDCLPADGPIDCAQVTAVATELRAAGCGRSVEDILLCVQIAVNDRDLSTDVACQLSLDMHRALATVSDVDAKKALAQEVLEQGLTAKQLARRLQKASTTKTTGASPADTDGLPSAPAPSIIDPEAGVKALMPTLEGTYPTCADDLIQLLAALAVILGHLIPLPAGFEIPSGVCSNEQIHMVRQMTGGAFDFEVSEEQGRQIVDGLADVLNRLKVARRFAHENWELADKPTKKGG